MTLVIAIIFFIISFVCSFLHHFNCWANTPPFLCGKSILFCLYLNKGQLITYGLALLAAIIIYSQIMSLQQQLQVQTLLDYSKQWSSSTMITSRQSAMNVLKYDDVTDKEVDLDQLEKVLELLEDFSIWVNYKVIDQKSVWKSSLGWYASRYFFYSEENGSIKAIRKKWGLSGKQDKTYYEELEELYKQYLDDEVDNVMKREQESKDEKRKKIIQAYHDTKDKFIQAEFGFTND